MCKTPRLILASSSPRRQELIRTLRLPCEIRASEVDESVPPGMAPADIVQTLAFRKADTAAALFTDADRHGIVIGADTIVIVDGDVLGKPADDAEAMRMLGRLQGRVHEVFSGIACVDAASGKRAGGHRMTRVSMKPLAADAIRRYVATGEPRDKAGAYAIQGFGATLVDRIEGDYFNVVGLPLSLLSDMLAEFGIAVI